MQFWKQVCPDIGGTLSYYLSWVLPIVGPLFFSSFDDVPDIESQRIQIKKPRGWGQVLGYLPWGMWDIKRDQSPTETCTAFSEPIPDPGRDYRVHCFDERLRGEKLGKMTWPTLLTPLTDDVNLMCLTGYAGFHAVTCPSLHNSVKKVIISNSL